MTRRALILPLLAVVAACAVPTGALAAGQTPGEALVAYRYAVTVEGSADYVRHDQDGAATEDADVQVGWTSQIPMFQFLGSLPTSGAGTLVGEPSVGVDYRTVVPEAEYTDTGRCVGGTLSAGASTLSASPNLTSDHH